MRAWCACRADRASGDTRHRAPWERGHLPFGRGLTSPVSVSGCPVERSPDAVPHRLAPCPCAHHHHGHKKHAEEQLKGKSADGEANAAKKTAKKEAKEELPAKAAKKTAKKEARKELPAKVGQEASFDRLAKMTDELNALVS